MAYPTTTQTTLTPDSEDIRRLIAFLAEQAEVELAILVGSRANMSAGQESDWDIAIQLSRNDGDGFLALGRLETLRRQLAEVLGVSEEGVDLIELPRARLAMRAVVAEEGLPLKGEDSLAWSHFLGRTWRDLEDYYWEKRHAA